MIIYILKSISTELRFIINIAILIKTYEFCWCFFLQKYEFSFWLGIK